MEVILDFYFYFRYHKDKGTDGTVPNDELKAVNPDDTLKSAQSGSSNNPLHVFDAPNGEN